MTRATQTQDMKDLIIEVDAMISQSVELASKLVKITEDEEEYFAEIPKGAPAHLTDSLDHLDDAANAVEELTEKLNELFNSLEGASL